MSNRNEDGSTEPKAEPTVLIVPLTATTSVRMTFSASPTLGDVAVLSKFLEVLESAVSRGSTPEEVMVSE